ncbi:uncharacterized protein KY384_004968 [Bacidia gigantensis]|uniref:uncharacterized protein n=1 Tax=Bacidia gigantensis TaxID=2732470 RepID=UPI001D05B9CB|nr:uncharacterized protein KY384_004968 [Bacidia gigantensis]KAG8530465.1 hypothetical protein KY384_004968 [Bacidia gigantensis]
MAKTATSQLLRPLRPLRSKAITPTFRHDPGILPQGTYLVRKPTGRGPPLPRDRTHEATTPIDYGQQIYMYSHIHTNQVVYSLTRQLNNTKAMDQIPFLGKKSKPASLRKDVWLPYCFASFPSAPAGLEAYRKLLEYKRLHETEYDVEDIRYQKGKLRGQLMGRKARAKVLMDQKANSVADLAEVLLQQGDGPVERRVEAANRRIESVKKLKKLKGEGNVKAKPMDIGKELQGTEGIVVRWADLRDAEFAEVWPAPVTHEGLQRGRYTAAFPTPSSETKGLTA